MSVLDKAKEHFREKVSGEPQCIDVPEWECKIYYKPMKMIVKSKLGKYMNDPFEYAVRALIERALDENGNKMFKPVEFKEMMHGIDPDIVEDIVLKMSKDDELEDIEKN